MKVCWQGINMMQISNHFGDVRPCCVYPIDSIGNILENTIPEIRRSKAYLDYITPMLQGDYSKCAISPSCYLYHTGKLKEHMTEVDGIPEYPEYLELCFENICNYRCTCCFAHENFKLQQMNKDAAKRCDLIAERVAEVLPHVKRIGANGAGELFASPRTLELLANWKPLAPPEQCSVVLETNGSLFTPENWKKIENLGQYHVTVTLTVMSFNEMIYQHLSGTKLPIARLEKNLDFIQELREKNIVNCFELATVLQEENFREIPAFIHRCFDRFHADRVRINQLFPGGIYDKNIQWFMDVRNPKHPYHEQYHKVMEDPIVHDPRVKVQNGIRAHEAVEFPAHAEKNKMDKIAELLSDPDLLTDELKDGKVAIYNMGVVGKTVATQYREKANIIRCYSTHTDMCEYNGIPVMPFIQEPGGADAPDVVVVTAYNGVEKAIKSIRTKLGDSVKIITLWEKLSD